MVKKKQNHLTERKFIIVGHLGCSVVEHLPLTQGLILGSGIESHVGEDSTPVEPVFLSAYVSASLS